jgi:hypothetical protein
MPGFVAASASDTKWLAAFEKMERGLTAADRLAANDPTMLDVLDKIQGVIGRADLTLKDRLLELVKLLTQVRDAIKMTH